MNCSLLELVNFNDFAFGLFLDTTLKFDFEKEKTSGVCIKKLLNNDDMLFKLLLFNLLASIIRKFFLFFKS